MNPQVHLGEVGGFGLYEAGDGIGGNLQGAEEDEGELCHMRRNGGGLLH